MYRNITITRAVLKVNLIIINITCPVSLYIGLGLVNVRYSFGIFWMFFSRILMLTGNPQIRIHIKFVLIRTNWRQTTQYVSVLFPSRDVRIFQTVTEVVVGWLIVALPVSDWWEAVTRQHLSPSRTTPTACTATKIASHLFKGVRWETETDFSRFQPLC